jgi:hypothetical protein
MTAVEDTLTQVAVGEKEKGPDWFRPLGNAAILEFLTFALPYP